MTSKRVARIIAARQAEQYQSLGWAPPDIRDVPDLARLLEFAPGMAIHGDKNQDNLNEIRSVGQDLPPYEDPVAYWYLQKTSEDVGIAAQGLGLPLSSMPTLATLPLGSVNARTVTLTDPPESIIFIDAGLAMFAAIMASAFGSSFPEPERRADGKLIVDLGLGDADTIGRRLTASDHALDTMQRAVLTYATTPHPSKLLELALGLSSGGALLSTPFASALFEGAYDFVVSHEYGHVIASHGRYLEDGPDLRPFEVIQHNWNMEFEADVYGVLLSTAAMTLTGGHGPELSYAGSEFLFGCLDVVYRCVSMLRHRDDKHTFTSTHPDPQTRREYQRHKLQENFGKDNAEPIIVLGRVFEKVVEVLWHRMRDDVVDMRMSGIEASTLWAL